MPINLIGFYFRRGAEYNVMRLTAGMRRFKPYLLTIVVMLLTVWLDTLLLPFTDGCVASNVFFDGFSAFDDAADGSILLELLVSLAFTSRLWRTLASRTNEPSNSGSITVGRLFDNSLSMCNRSGLNPYRGLCRLGAITINKINNKRWNNRAILFSRTFFSLAKFFPLPGSLSCLP